MMKLDRPSDRDLSRGSTDRISTVMYGTKVMLAANFEIDITTRYGMRVEQLRLHSPSVASPPSMQLQPEYS